MNENQQEPEQIKIELIKGAVLWFCLYFLTVTLIWMVTWNGNLISGESLWRGVIPSLSVGACFQFLPAFVALTVLAVLRRKHMALSYSLLTGVSFLLTIAVCGLTGMNF